MEWRYVDPMREENALENFQADFAVALSEALLQCVRRHNNGWSDRRASRAANGEEPKEACV